MEKLIDRLRNRDVLFISTKNKDYIRNQQEIRILKATAKTYEEIVYQDKCYLKRVLKVYVSCFRTMRTNVDVIFVGFAPQLLLPFLKYWSKRKCVTIDFFISFFDTFVYDREYFKRGSLGAKLMHKIDEITLRSCQCVIADTKADKEFFSDEFHIPPDKIEVLYMEADRKIYNKHKFCMEKMSVLYFGSALPLQGIEIISDAVRLLEGEKDISFTMIGPFRTGCNRKYNDGNVEFYDWMPQDQLARKIANAGCKT